MTDRYFTEQFEACTRQPHLDPVMWGPGFPGYDQALSTADNIARRYGAPDYFDVVFITPGGLFLDQSLQPYHPKTIIAIRLHEAWSDRFSGAWRRANADLIFYSFPHDMFQAAVVNEGQKRVFVHVPMSADRTVFYDEPRRTPGPAPAKTIDALMIGANGPTCYPMRWRLTQLIEAGRLPGQIRRHPGYAAPMMTMDEYARVAHQRNASTVLAQVRDYAAQIRASKLVFVTASFYRYGLQKFAEVALSGVVMVGTVPQERESDLRSVMVELRDTDSDEHIIRVVNWWLEHDAEREALAARAQQLALLRMTWDTTFADRLVEAYVRYRRGEYGWWFPHEYTVREPRRNVCDCNPRRAESDYILGPRCPHTELLQ